MGKGALTCALPLFVYLIANMSAFSFARDFFVGPKTVKTDGETITPRETGRSVQLYCLTTTVFSSINFRHDTNLVGDYSMEIAQGMVIPEVTEATITTGLVMVLFT